MSIPIWNKFKQECSNIRIPIPERLNSNTIKEVRFHHKYNARCVFQVACIVEQVTKPQPPDKNQALAVKLGLNNPETCVSTSGANFIVDEKRLKSLNH